MLSDCGFKLPADMQGDLFWEGVSVTTNGIERDFREKVCAEIRLLDEGVDRYRVFTPFQFDDGDHLAIVLKREDHRLHEDQALFKKTQRFIRQYY